MNPAAANAAAGPTHPALIGNLHSPASTTHTNESVVGSGDMSTVSLNPPPPPPPPSSSLQSASTQQPPPPPPPIVDLTQIENYAMGPCDDPYSMNSMNLLNH